MKLEIGNIHVKDIQFGDELSYRDGVLTVNKEEAIAALNKDGALKNVDLKVARPGESIRILRSKQLWSPVTVPIAAVFFQAIQGLLFLQVRALSMHLKICLFWQLESDRFTV